MKPLRLTWVDRVTRTMAPRWTLDRVRARMAVDLLHRHYEGAAAGRRTQGWHRGSADANAATGPFIGRLRDVARDLVRNNPYAESAITTIVDQTVGWGLTAKPSPASPRLKAAWDAWANTTACDADARNDFAGLQKMVLRAVVQDGEVLVRRRWRRPEDGLPLPLQLQVLEADFLDTTKHGITTAGGGRIVYGVEFNAIGQRVAYWLYPEHPGNSGWVAPGSVRVPAGGILHVFRPTRPGAVRGASWYAPVLLRMKDYDEYEDATLMKQKIAACLAVLTTDVDGTQNPLGSEDEDDETVDWLEPGMIKSVPAGQAVEVVQPPSVGDYKDYAEASLRSQAAGLGVTYEDYTGDYTELPFSAARMSRLRIWSQVEDRRWRMLVPQFCDPSWRWAMEAAQVLGLASSMPTARWTAPPLPMIEPDKEGLAYQRLIRNRLISQSEAIRERGYDPDELYAEMAKDDATLDALGLVSDSDPRKMTQAGQTQQPARAAAAAGADVPSEDDNDDEDASRRVLQLRARR